MAFGELFDFSRRYSPGRVDELENLLRSDLVHPSIFFSVPAPYRFCEVSEALDRVQADGLHKDMKPYHIPGTYNVWHTLSGDIRWEMVDLALQELVTILLSSETGYSSVDGIIKNASQIDFGYTSRRSHKTVSVEGRRLTYGLKLNGLLEHVFDGCVQDALLHGLQMHSEVGVEYSDLQPYHFARFTRWKDRKGTLRRPLVQRAMTEFVEVALLPAYGSLSEIPPNLSANDFRTKKIKYGATLRGLMRTIYNGDYHLAFNEWVENRSANKKS
jgi:hypothetical protein